MVRKQTWVLLIIFGLLLAGAFYLQKNPLPASGSGTPTTPATTPTQMAQMLEGWQAGDIVSIEYQDAVSGQTIRFTQDGQGNWTAGPQGGQPVDAGILEEVRAQLASARAQAVLDLNYALEPIGLSAPADTIVIKNPQGMQRTIRIGQKTPTGSGYYVRVDDQAPIVVSTGAVEGFLDRIKNDLVVEPAPAATETQLNAAP